MTTETIDQIEIVKPYEVRNLKVRVQKPKVLEEVFHQTRQKRSIYYFTTGRKFNARKIDLFKHEERDNPFELPPVDNLLKKRAVDKEIRDEERKADRKKKVYEKHTHRTRLMLDLNERLMVSGDGDQIGEGIVGIDKQFFTIVKGRPLKEKRFDLRKYVENIKEGLRSRLKTGYIHDEIYLIERQQNIETKTIEDIKRKLQEYTNSFDEFLAKDNDRSMTLLRQASEEASKTNLKREELNNALEKFVKLKCDMYSLEETWSKGNACKNFLYEISPQIWKKRYERQLAKTSHKKDEVKLNLTASLESLLEPFIKETATQCPPLYFTEPWELRYIFREMELKNQNALLHSESLRKPNEIANAYLETTRDYYNKETKIIEDNLREMEKFILVEENRAVVLKETAMKFVNTSYKNAVSGVKATLLHAHVQNAYEACIALDGTELSVLEMLRDLEIEYKQLLLELDRLPIECVREAKYFVKKDTAFIFGQAREARRKVNYLDILLRRMVNAIEPPVKKTTRPLVFRSEPPPPVPKQPPPPKELTAEEQEFIHFFTDKGLDERLDESKLFFPLGF